ncbi:MAG: iron ABC transporter permease [Syntrophobacterales bacterium]|nr:iron ABC transporter permease [Syntrophobacterales bacterium]
MKRNIRWIFVIAVLFLALAGVSLLSLCTGAAAIPPGRILTILFTDDGSTFRSILVDIRIPRLILGFSVGGALSLAGVILQGTFRNNLVEPYTLGISGGAALGVSVAAIMGLGHMLGVYAQPAAGFAGSLLVILFLYLMNASRGALKAPSLLLTGVMVSFISSSFVLLIMSISRTEQLHDILFWIIGSLGEADWILVKFSLFVTLSGLAVSYLFCVDLNALALGEDEALHLGVNVERTKQSVLVVASLLAGVSVSISGVIGFVGLVVPHFVRMWVGVDHRIVMIASFLSGAIFLILCDTAAKTLVMPMELPVGVITGILGGILFIYALTKKELSLGRQ